MIEVLFCAGSGGSSMTSLFFELQHVRDDVVLENEYFEDPNVPMKDKSERLLFVFVRDLMDGINGKLTS